MYIAKEHTVYLVQRRVKDIWVDTDIQGLLLADIIEPKFCPSNLEEKTGRPHRRIKRITTVFEEEIP
jgi:hypothetical protein